MNTLVRHMAAATFAPIVAGALFESRVLIWHTANQELIAELDTILDFGGRRIAVNAEGNMLFIGSYGKKAICSYRIPDGEVDWKRDGVKPVQRIFFGLHSNTLACGVDAGKTERTLVLDSESGATVEDLARTRWLIEDTVSGTRLLIGKPLRIVKPDNTVIDVPNETFAVLAAAFGEGIVAFSEAGGDVRCISIETGHEIWRYRPGEGRHVLDLAYYESYGKFYGLEWHYLGSPAHKYLIKIDGSTGLTEVIREFESLPASAFSQYDQLLYTYDGLGIDVRTGEVVKRLPLS